VPAPKRRRAAQPATKAVDSRTTRSAPASRSRRIRDDSGDVAPVEPTAANLRVVLVEDLPDVTAHVRELLRAQSAIRIVEVVKDGRKVVDEVRELRPDVVVLDSLLSGRVSATGVIERLRKASVEIPIVAIDVPAQPMSEHLRRQVDAVVSLPFGTFDLVRAIRDAAAAGAARDPRRQTRAIAVYAAKGGVGKTTLAYNLAVAVARSGLRTALIDGSLQNADVRRQLRVDPDQPSICDLPTDCVRVSDLADTMYRDPSGIEVLLAPPRLELADLITGRDIDKIVDLVRRSHQAIVIDTPSALNETTLAMLDVADVILHVLTPEPAALDSTRAAAAAFEAIGYPEAKVRTVINRVGATGGLTVDQLTRALGRRPHSLITSDWPLVAASNQEGVPFVLARPDAQVSRDVAALADELALDVSTRARQPQRQVRRRTLARA
jgi:pilus assembly protein CpaE